MQQAQRGKSTSRKKHASTVEGRLLRPSLPFSLSFAFAADALSIDEEIVKWNLLALCYFQGMVSLREIARALYEGPRRLGRPLPSFIDQRLVQMVGGKLDAKRLSTANYQVETLFARHFGFGPLLAGEREGLGYDHLTADGRKAAAVISYLVYLWTDCVITGARPERVG